jgi:DNA-binding response OmpR family regulator/predicted Ser/Thr protein kinase
VSQVSELRHELRTPINQIVGYCEILLEDANDSKNPARSEPLTDALVAVREALSMIDAALPPELVEFDADRIGRLYESLHEPQSRINDAMSRLLHDETGIRDAAFIADVCRIRNAAERLLPTDRPRAEPTSMYPVPEAFSAATTASNAINVKSAHLLVVDDIEENRGVLKRRLEREGHSVVTAENGKRALEAMAKEPFDIVLLDVMMPEMDGYETLGEIKGDEKTRDIPVIMISALDDIASIVRCIERGAEDYLPKPFDPVLLRARISACLDRKEMRDREKEYLANVTRVTAAAASIERGEYSSGALSEIAKRPDELGTLARVFDSMAAGIKERESRLRGQIDNLRREISAASGDAEISPATGEMALPAGETFAGRYKIVKLLGRGGMGTVYLAEDAELGEKVAIKTIRSDLITSDESAMERFRNEIRLARKVTSRNIVRTHDFGKADDVYFVTMEYVEGMTLRALLDKRGRLDTDSTLAIARQLADALECAHEQGIIHRDLKPENLLLDASGTLKVMDFGVARLAERTTNLTQAGMVVGTPAYMAPEQLLSEEVDARSDLYSVGVILYECLTGKPPFEAKSPISLIAKVLNETAVAPEVVKPDVPHAISELVMRLLAKQPNDRIQNAKVLNETLATAG